jgi:hypothetical protein
MGMSVDPFDMGFGQAGLFRSLTSYKAMAWRTCFSEISVMRCPPEIQALTAFISSEGVPSGLDRPELPYNKNSPKPASFSIFRSTFHVICFFFVN